MKRGTEPLPISFTVDRTSPAIFISGIEDKGRYQSAAKEMMIEVIDNLALEGVDIQIGNRKMQYGKGELKEKNGIIKEQIFKDENWQEVKICAIDAAKNKQQERLSILVMPDFLQKEKSQNNIIKMMSILFLAILGLVWKKKKGCFILK